ncbi:hypothetical protein QAD02_023471 [Eretmocerus hayati]|uniref:Uncharacterized protein n=1 Tax=Eretmocerus hayati TaxID=131215 RepID=A0ACC2PWA8_9HYME|nr:hypothetical protein QAD02_023471 [Eretmocerus hayati]
MLVHKLAVVGMDMQQLRMLEILGNQQVLEVFLDMLSLEYLVVLLMVGKLIAEVRGLYHGIGNNGTIGGDPTIIENHPYAVILEINKKINCAGSIITESYIVTSAICASKTNNETIIRAGTTYKKQGGSDHRVNKIFIHKNFNYENYTNNIGLIRVLEPIKFDKSRKAIPIFNQNEKILAGRSGIVSGWGEAKNETTENPQLHEIEVNIIDHDSCKMSAQKYVDDGVICASSGKNKSKAVCNNDWGDPLVIDGRLAGIQSWILNSCTEKYLSGYTKISHYSSWIDEHIQN